MLMIILKIQLLLVRVKEGLRLTQMERKDMWRRRMWMIPEHSRSQICIIGLAQVPMVLEGQGQGREIYRTISRVLSVIDHNSNSSSNGRRCRIIHLVYPLLRISHTSQQDRHPNSIVKHPMIMKLISNEPIRWTNHHSLRTSKPHCGINLTHKWTDHSMDLEWDMEPGLRLQGKLLIRLRISRISSNSDQGLKQELD